VPRAKKATAQAAQPAAAPVLSQTAQPGKRESEEKNQSRTQYGKG